MTMKILLLDIETAPNQGVFWGLFKQNISINQILEPGYTLCWSAKWYKQRGMKVGSLHTDGKEVMLKEIHSLLDEADAVVTYNGDRFDLPILNQEFAKSNMQPPSPYKTIDLLKTVRRNFRLTSNKLDYVAQFFGLGNKIKHKGMDLWHECMAGDDTAWRQMEAYNKRDVTLLEGVYRFLMPWIPNHPNHGVYVSSTKPVCPNCGSRKMQKRGFAFTKTLKYQQYQCQGCGKWSRARLNSSTPEDKEHVLVG